MNFVGASSRYASSPVVYYGPLNKITFPMYQRKTYKKSAGDTYLVIPPGYEYRPDLVSYKAYGVTDYWWVIMEANGIQDVIDFKRGRNIWIPADIYG